MDSNHRLWTDDMKRYQTSGPPKRDRIRKYPVKMDYKSTQEFKISIPIVIEQNVQLVDIENEDVGKKEVVVIDLLPALSRPRGSIFIGDDT